MSHKIRYRRLYGVNALSGDADYLLTHPVESYLYFFHIRSQQSQACQCSRSYGETLAGSGRGIAEGIEDIGTAADLRVQTAHLGIASCIVGYRTVSVGSQRDSESRQHSHCSDTDTVEAETEIFSRKHGRKIEIYCAKIRQQYRYRNGNYRNSRRQHAEAHA